MISAWWLWYAAAGGLSWLGLYLWLPDNPRAAQHRAAMWTRASTRRRLMFGVGLTVGIIIHIATWPLSVALVVYRALTGRQRGWGEDEAEATSVPLQTMAPIDLAMFGPVAQNVGHLRDRVADGTLDAAAAAGAILFGAKYAHDNGLVVPAFRLFEEAKWHELVRVVLPDVDEDFMVRCVLVMCETAPPEVLAWCAEAVRKRAGQPET